MRFELWLVAAANLLAAAEAKAFMSWVDDSPSWVPPRETGLGGGKTIGVVPGPAPTGAPMLNHELLKRQDGNNTCGYINGVVDAASAIACNIGWTCYPEQFLSVMGCCSAGSNCAVETTCFNRAESASYTGNGAGRTRLCSDSLAPFCAKGVYTDSSYSGYEVLFCDTTARVYSLSYVPPQALTTASTTSSSSSSSTSTSSTSTTTQTQTQTPAPASTPIGAIVGGVVGGVAAIGLIILGFIFLWRRKPKQEPPTGGNTEAAAYSSVPQYPSGQEAGQDRSSIMKPPYRGSGMTSLYDPSHASSVLGSPPPPGYGHYSPQPPHSAGFPSPQPYPQSAAYAQPSPYQPPTHQQAPTHQQVAELPVERSDGQLRELA